MFGKKIEVENYGSLNFIPCHRLKKLNDGVEPYLKTVSVGGPEFTFFKVKGIIYAVKPSDKKDFSKLLCVRVENPVTLKSADGSITGNCAKGVKQDYVDLLARLINSGLSNEEIFKHIVLNLDN